LIRGQLSVSSRRTELEAAMIPPAEALNRLIEGNRRFAADVLSIDTLLRQRQRDMHAEGQRPFAVILGCSDSRVPVETVFDQTTGDLFVIRVAGNIVAPSQIGSVEFAVERFDTRLVVVLGHTLCGAVKATLEELQSPNAKQSHNVYSIVSRIRPAVETLFHTDLKNDLAELERQATRANVRASVDGLVHGSPMLEERAGRGEVLIVGAEYAVQTGVVNFFEGMPA
jgi:carbonic anhydrase